MSRSASRQSRALARLQQVALAINPADLSTEALAADILPFDLGPEDPEVVSEQKRQELGLLGTLGEQFVRPGAYYLFHSWRLFGYFYAIPPALYLRPKETLATMALYAAVHRQQWWQRSVHNVLGYGASRRHKLVNENAHLINDDQRYLFSQHPHSVLADGWHSIVARNPVSFERSGMGIPGMGRKISLCFAPIIAHVPVHQEMYRDMCGDAGKKSVMQWWETSDIDPLIIPGGFAEAVFANSNDTKHEYSYIKDRKGFIKIAVEAGKDIVPLYTFRATRMYMNPGYLRGWRARFSQKYFIGLVPFMGWMGTSMPLTDKTTTVLFPPFEASKYSPEQVDEAHAAYLEHLKYHFDENKAKYGMRDTELVYVGNDWVDDDVLSRALTWIGLLKPPAKL